MQASTRASERLFVSLRNAGQVGTYDRPPLIVVYDVATGVCHAVDRSRPVRPIPSRLRQPTQGLSRPSPTNREIPGVVQRVAGSSRTSTAVEVSQVSYPEGAEVAVGRAGGSVPRRPRRRTPWRPDSVAPSC